LKADLVGRDVFVSYSHPDRQCAFALVEHLESRGISVWIAPRDIVPASDWAEEIIDAIGGARILVLVFSSHTNASPQVRREIERAVHKGLPVLPFRIEDVMPSKSLEYFLSSQHWLDAFPPPIEPYLDRLSTSVASLLAGGRPVPEQRPATQPVCATAAAAANFSGLELQALERQLAQHIGPLAKLLVARAAACTGDWGLLTQKLAGEIDAPAARQQFLRAAQTLVRPHA
jgi:hypothetical protein